MPAPHTDARHNLSLVAGGCTVGQLAPLTIVIADGGAALVFEIFEKGEREGTTLLEKILTIENVGCFERFSKPGNSLVRTVLVYGANGSGKTTLSSILRAAASGDAAAILERRRLGAADPCRVQLRIDGGNAVFDGASWSKPCERLLVFNREFVHTHVFVGREIGPSQRQALYELALGDAAVKVRTSLDIATRAFAEARTARARIHERLSARLQPIGATVEQLKKVAPGTSEPEQLASLRAQLASRRAGPSLASLPSPVLPAPLVSIDFDRLRVLLKTTVAGVSEEATNAVRAHVAERLDGAGEAWLAQGVRYAHAARDCPFCEQGLSSSSFATLLAQFFDQAYVRHKGTVEAGLRRVEELGTHADTWLATYQSNLVKLEAWKRYGNFGEPPSAQEVARLRPDCFDAVRSVLERKIASPLTEVAEDARISQAALVAGAAATASEAYRDWLTSVRASIRTLQADEVAASTSLTKKVQDLELAELRNDPAIVEQLELLEQAERAVMTAKAEAHSLRDALRKASAEVTTSFVQQVNAWLADFGATFTVEDLTAKPSASRLASDFALNLGCGRIRASARPGRDPTFDTLLSEGDRSTLALAVFATATLRRTDLEHCTIVLDDPFSSLDRDRRNKTCRLAARFAKEAAQLIVLSHDEYFLRDVAAISTAPVTERQLVAASALEEWSAKEACKASYFRNLARLREYADGGGSANDATDIWNLLRPVLEEHLRFRFPGWWVGNSWLGDFVRDSMAGVVRPGTRPIPYSRPELLKLEEWKDFANPPHHGQGEQPRPPPSPAELRRYCREIVDFLES